MNAQPDLDFSPRANRVAYWNSTGLRGDELAGAKVAAGKQDELALAIFRGERRPLAPSEVHRIGRARGSQWLLTSVRRSLNTLTASGALAKCDEYRAGPYGRPERVWRLVERA